MACERVVEIVRDARGELADGAHSLVGDQRLAHVCERAIGLNAIRRFAEHHHRALRLARPR